VDYPGERLIACRNPVLQARREATRTNLINATINNLNKIKASVDSGKLKKKDAIALTVGRVIDKHKMKKHFNLELDDCFFNFSLNNTSIDREKVLDGVYVIRTSLPVKVLSKEDCVRQYKNLSQVESAFRSMKTVDLKIRPIYHFLDDRIRSHVFIIMLSYYVEWHMRLAWKDITYADPILDEIKKTRDPVATALPSLDAQEKASTHRSNKYSRIKVQRFEMILEHLAGICEVKMVLRTGGNFDKEVPFMRRKCGSQLQQMAMKLIKNIPKYPRL
jgi:transposase